MHLVFYFIPYRAWPEIGGLDQDFETENPVRARKCHPGCQKVPFSVIFLTFLAKMVKTGLF